MAWIYLDYSCWISGMHKDASPNEAIQVSEADAIALTTHLQMARMAEGPTITPSPTDAKPTKKPSNPPVSEP